MESYQRLHARRRHQRGRQRESVPGEGPVEFASGSAVDGAAPLRLRRAESSLRESRFYINPSLCHQRASWVTKVCATRAPPIIAVYVWYPLEGVQSNLIQGFGNGYHSSRMDQSGRATWPPGPVIGGPILSSKSRRRVTDYLSQSDCATLSLGPLIRHRPLSPKAGKTRLVVID